MGDFPEPAGPPYYVLIDYSNVAPSQLPTYTVVELYVLVASCAGSRGRGLPGRVLLAKPSGLQRSLAHYREWFDLVGVADAVDALHYQPFCMCSVSSSLSAWLARECTWSHVYTRNTCLMKREHPYE